MEVNANGENHDGPARRHLPTGDGPSVGSNINFAQSMIGAAAPSGTGLQYGFTPVIGRNQGDLYLGSPPGSAASNPQNLQTLAYGFRRGWLGQDNVYQGYANTRVPQDRSVRRRLIEPVSRARQLTPVPELQQQRQQPEYGYMDEAAAYPISQTGHFITSTPEYAPERVDEIFTDPKEFTETLRKMLKLGDEQQAQAEQIEQGIFAVNLNESSDDRDRS